MRFPFLTWAEVGPVLNQKTLLLCRQTIFFTQLYRHGDRSPVKTYPKDPYQEEKWPQGFGQLTKVGQKPTYKASGCAIEWVTSGA